MSQQQKPSVARMVHYVAYGTPKGEFKPAHRAATITEVRESDGACKLCIMNPTGLFFSDWLPQDEDKKESGTWHWPERI